MTMDMKAQDKPSGKDPTPDDIEGYYGCILLIVLAAIGTVTGIVLVSVIN